MNAHHLHPGYAFIPLPNEVDRRPRPQARHDRHHPGTYTGILDVTWLLEQPVHIGSGYKALVRERDTTVIVRQQVRLGGVPCVPGSTLKGVLRARYEALTRSCAEAPKVPRQSNSYHFKGSTVRLLDSARRAPALMGKCEVTKRAPHESQLCPACALFGLMNLRSRIVITDALPATDALEQHELPAQFGPRFHHIGAFRHDEVQNVLEVNRLHGRKFAVGRDERPPPEGRPQAPNKQRVEVLPVGARLRHEVRFFNLIPAELGGLLAALGHNPPSRLKLGAGKSHGLGRVHLEHLAPPRVPPGRPAPDLARCLAEFRADPGCHLENLERLVGLHAKDC